MAEVVDVVNPDDKVIDQMARERCHNENMIHRGVAIFVFRTDDMNELLLQKRSSIVAIKPDLIGLTGGHVLAGETYEEAAEREFAEELFNTTENRNVEMEELFKLKKSTDGDHQFVTVFRAVAKGPFDLLDQEVSQVFFRDFDEVLDEVQNDAQNFTDTTRLLVEEYEDRIRSKDR